MADRSFLDWPFFEDRHRDLASEVDAWADANVASLVDEADIDGSCRALVAAMGDAGLLTHAVARTDGGAAAALDVRSLCLIRETLARHHGLADFAFAMQGLGSGPVSLFGDDRQRQRILPAVSSGRTLAAFALSEPQAGSDVAALQLTARPDGDAFVLDGEKTWISNGGIADHYVVFARTGEGDGARGLSAFFVEADTPGLTIVERIDVIAPHPLARLRFDGCRVPADSMIGEPGRGFAVAMATLDVFRSTVGAAALGFARRALDEAIHHAAGREIAGTVLGDYQMTQAKLADMATDVDAAALLVYRAAWTKDQGAPRVTREAAMAKLFATERAQAVIDQAVQIHGGLGVRKGVKVEELYRDIRALRIYEGTSEIQKIVIARQLMADAPAHR